MSRSLPGGANTDNLAATIAAYDSGPWSAFGWYKWNGVGGGTNERIFHVGNGTSGQIFYGSTSNLALEQQFATLQMTVSDGAFGTNTGVWAFSVAAYDGSSFAPSSPGGGLDFWTGLLATPMASQGSGVVNTGSGARTTGLVDLVIGNRQNGLNRCWNGELFGIGMVPYYMNVWEAEQLRRGKPRVAQLRGQQIFHFMLDGSQTSDVSGHGYNLTVTGTTVTADPQTFNFTLPVGTVIGESYNNAFSSASAYTTASFTPPSGTTVLVVAVAYQTTTSSTAPTPTLTDSQGHTWTLEKFQGQVGQAGGARDGGVAIFTAPNASTTPFTLSAQCGGRTIRSWMVQCFVVYQGTLTSRQSAANFGQSGSPSVTLAQAPFSSDSIVFACIQSDSDGSNTVAANLFQVAESPDPASGTGPVLNTQTGTAAATETVYGWTQANVGFTAVALEISNGGGGASAVYDATRFVDPRRPWNTRPIRLDLR